MTHRHLLACTGLLTALLLPAAADAGIYKCVGPDGSVEYRDLPCDENYREKIIQAPVIGDGPEIQAADETGSGEAAEGPGEGAAPQARQTTWPGGLPALPFSLWQLALLVCALMSVIAFFSQWYDKQSAVANRPRVSETALHVQELLGGWPGSLLAQQLFRHKTAKTSYQVDFWLIVLLHAVVWFGVLGGFRWLKTVSG